jgi:hypothetical protein
MPENPAAAVVAHRRQRVDRTLEAVEDVGRSAQRYLKGLVVVVTTNFTGFHRMLPWLSEMWFAKRRRMVRGRKFWTAINSSRPCLPAPGPYASYRLLIGVSA